jgi:hypothetical protein
MVSSVTFVIPTVEWLATCTFDKTPTVSILGFEGLIFVATVACLLLLSKLQKQIGIRFLLVSAGILIFELFTGPMWHNYHLGVWGYVYRDVSWVLTLGWAVLLLSVITISDRLLPNWKEPKRFLIYMIVLLLIAFPLESLMVNLGIRGYADETLGALSGVRLLNVPIEALYYIPVFMGLVICFYKYWSFVLVDDQPLIPLKDRKWLRSFSLAFVAIFLFEVMIEPMVSNQQFPQWSYVFHDISLFVIGIWIAIVGAAAAIVGRYFAHYPTPFRFLIALGITSGLAIPIEAWLIHHHYRVYAENVVHEYTGYQLPVLNVPIELAFGIPFYMALIIAFIRYWETVIDNRL